MKNITELRATLAMVKARLLSDPQTAEEWETIRKALVAAANYAKSRTLEATVSKR